MGVSSPSKKVKHWKTKKHGRYRLLIVEEPLKMWLQVGNSLNLPIQHFLSWPLPHAPLKKLNSLFFSFTLRGGGHHAACGTLVPLTRDQTGAPAMQVQSLNHWINREVPIISYFLDMLLHFYLLISQRSFFWLFYVHGLIVLSVSPEYFTLLQNLSKMSRHHESCGKDC